MPKLVISYTILKKYLAILDPFPVNIGIQKTIPAITAPLIITIVPNDSSVDGYVHTKSKNITRTPIYRVDFLYLLPCSPIPSDKTYTDPISEPMPSSLGYPIIAVSLDRDKSYSNQSLTSTSADNSLDSSCHTPFTLQNIYSDSLLTNFS